MTAKFTAYGILAMSHGTLLVTSGQHVPDGVLSKETLSGTIIPVSGGLADGDWAGSGPGELQEYLKSGMVFRGAFALEKKGATLFVTGGTSIVPIGTEKSAPMTDIEQLHLEAVQDYARDLSEYREAWLSRGVEVSLNDWQGVERADKTTADSLRVTVNFKEDEISLSSRDGRKLSLEFQNDDLRVLSYEAEPGKDSPIVVKIPPQGDISVDRQDYDLEERLDPEDEAPSP